MDATRNNSNPAVARFWDRFISFLSDQGVKESLRQWYVQRTEGYLHAMQNKKLVQHTAADVNEYFTDLGRQRRLKDWQFRQSVDAIRQLFKFIDADLQHRVDWEYWMDSSQSLNADHRTIARDIPFVSIVSQHKSQTVLSKKQLKHKYADVRQTLVTEIRRRAYAISTEKAYEYWLFYFIAFHNGHDPRLMGNDEAKSFLEFLAVNRNVTVATQNLALNARLAIRHRDAINGVCNIKGSGYRFFISSNYRACWQG